MPYLPNLSAPEGELYQKSLKVFEDEIIRCNITSNSQSGHPFR